MKRTLAILLAVMLLMTCALAEPATSTTDAPEAVETTGAGKHEILRYEIKAYLGSMEYSYQLPLCFVDGVNDLPWIDLEDFCAFMNAFEQQYFEDTNYSLTYEAEDEQVWLTRETEYFMNVDFGNNTIFFNDYDAFLHDSSTNALVDLVSASGYDEEGRGELFEHIDTGSYDRYGDSILLRLNDYGIQLIHQDNYYLVPAQTLSDFVFAVGTGLNLMYNGDEVFCANADCLGCVDDQTTPLTELGERYYSGKTGERSEALATYGYNELCLMLDKLYGLKEIHDITSFDQLFTQLAYKDDLLSTDPHTADVKLYEFIDLHLDDIHSNFSGYSYLTGAKATEGRFGMMGRRLNSSYSLFESARAKYYPDGPAGYEEVGNTAYITFDNFHNSTPSTYYTCIENNEDLPNDTIGLIIYAHNKIYRKDSPIENVVFDLSCNRGGSLNSAAFVLGWVLGEAPVSLKDTFSGAMSTTIYHVDTNLDREFNRGDQVDDKKIYCLISPCSFSCGNFVPATFKSTGQATLLGRTSGGGSCLVQSMSTAWGTYFEISGPQRMSLMKNGAYYDIDQGVEPDFIINNINNFYDREALTNYINGLF